MPASSCKGTKTAPASVPETVLVLMTRIQLRTLLLQPPLLLLQQQLLQCRAVPCSALLATQTSCVAA